MYASLPGSQEDRFEALRVIGAKCALCIEPFDFGTTVMCCYHCGAPAHVRCLASRMLREAGDESEVIPFEGSCSVPSCARHLLWPRLVKDAQTYRPKVCADEQVVEGAAVALALGPLVWRVDDSSDDDSSDDEDSKSGDGDEDSNSDIDEVGSDGESEHAVGGGVSCSSGAFSETALTQAAEEEEDDDFWRLNGESPRLTQGIVEKDEGGCGKMGRKKQGSGSDVDSDMSSSPRSPLTINLTQLENSFDLTTSCISGGMEAGNQDSPSSPPTVSLAERLRLRRLGGH